MDQPSLYLDMKDGMSRTDVITWKNNCQLYNYCKSNSYPKHGCNLPEHKRILWTVSRNKSKMEEITVARPTVRYHGTKTLNFYQVYLKDGSSLS